MDDYIEYVADSLLAHLNVPAYYKTLNPVRVRWNFCAVIIVLTLFSVPVHGLTPYAGPVELL